MVPVPGICDNPILDYISRRGSDPGGLRLSLSAVYIVQVSTVKVHCGRLVR